MNIVERFSKKVKKTRLDKNLTQEEVAFKAGLSVQFYSKVERGGVNPSLETIEKIAKGLKVEIKNLF